MIKSSGNSAEDLLHDINLYEHRAKVLIKRLPGGQNRELALAALMRFCEILYLAAAKFAEVSASPIPQNGEHEHASSNSRGRKTAQAVVSGGN